MQLVDAEDDEDDDVDGDDPSASSPANDGGDPSSNEEDALLRRLRQSQARMEQIKRMLVTQRGFIVKSLRAVAESRMAVNVGTAAADEKDRTLGATLRHKAHRINAAQQQQHQVNGDVDGELGPDDHHHHPYPGGKTCPMCEAAFPSDVDEEAFESHVVEHFCFEEAETLKYVPMADMDQLGDQEQGEIATADQEKES